MRNMGEIFQAFEQDEQLSVETALFGEGDIVERLADENDTDNALLSLESAGIKVSLVYGGAAALEDISAKINEAKAEADAGNVTVESAQEVTAFIVSKLESIGMKPEQLGFEEENLSVESAASFPAATINALAAIVADENLSVEAAAEANQTKWQKFKAWVKKVVDGALAILVKVWNFLSKAFVGNETTISRLQTALSSYTDKIVPGKTLNRSDFHATFPYLVDYSVPSFTAVANTLKQDVTVLTSVANMANQLAEEQGKTDAALKQIISSLPSSNAVDSGKAIYVKYIGEGQKLLAKLKDADYVAVVDPAKAVKTKETGNVKVAKLDEIKALLNAASGLNDKYRKELPDFQKKLKAITNKSPKDNSGFSTLTSVLSAVNLMAANSSKTVSALIKVAAKHTSLHVKK